LFSAEQIEFLKCALKLSQVALNFRPSRYEHVCCLDSRQVLRRHRPVHRWQFAYRVKFEMRSTLRICGTKKTGRSLRPAHSCDRNARPIDLRIVISLTSCDRSGELICASALEFAIKRCDHFAVAVGIGDIQTFQKFFSAQVADFRCSGQRGLSGRRNDRF